MRCKPSLKDHILYDSVVRHEPVHGPFFYLALRRFRGKTEEFQCFWQQGCVAFLDASLFERFFSVTIQNCQYDSAPSHLRSAFHPSTVERTVDAVIDVSHMPGPDI